MNSKNHTYQGNKNQFSVQRIFVLLFVLHVPVHTFSKNHVPDSTGKNDVTVIHNPETAKKEKEAMLILNGFGDSKKGRRHQKNYFDTVGYDLYIPDYLSKESFNATYENFSSFYDHSGIGEYKRVHVLAYILGAWILNTYINNNGRKNITTIVYDRSPLQERAPKVVSAKIPRLGKMVAGQVLQDLTTIEYPPIDTTGIMVGVLVESKATNLIRLFRKKTMSYGSIDWHNLDFNQPHSDMIYTRLNHDQMYITFEEVGPDIMSFIRSGRFLSNSRRVAFDWDPFKKYKG